jgi:hypothetical protein
VKGEGAQQDYGMRIYDPRIGKFLSVDPLTKDYPFNSPYAFAENDVIRSIDLEGLERLIVINNNDKYGRTYSTTRKGIRNKDTKEAVEINLQYANGRDVTGMDVVIITKMIGKRDKLTETDLNNNYNRQVKTSPVDTRKSENDDLMDIPPGAKSAITADEDFNNQILRGQQSYDEATHEPFLKTRNFRLSTPVRSAATTAPANMILTTAKGLDNSKSSINFESNFMSEQANSILTNFKNTRGVDVAVIDNVTLNILPSDKHHYRLVAADLEKRLNIKVNLKETNLRLFNGSTARSGFYSLSVNVSGVKN